MRIQSKLIFGLSLIALSCMTSATAWCGLKVYQSDGTTLIGNYVGQGNISGLLIAADPTSGAQYYFMENASGTIFYSGAGCTGTPYVSYSTTQDVVVDDGVTVGYVPINYGGSSTPMASYRSAGGCTAWNFSLGGAAPLQSLPKTGKTCGNGPCIIK